jgi:hypothetical protein
VVILAFVLLFARLSRPAAAAFGDAALHALKSTKK